MFILIISTLDNLRINRITAGKNGIYTEPIKYLCLFGFTLATKCPLIFIKKTKKNVSQYA